MITKLPQNFCINLVYEYPGSPLLGIAKDLQANEQGRNCNLLKQEVVARGEKMAMFG
jgi:hypothetical protein